MEQITGVCFTCNSRNNTYDNSKMSPKEFDLNQTIVGTCLSPLKSPLNFCDPNRDGSLNLVQRLTPIVGPLD